MEQKGEKERSQRSRLGENARQRVHHNVLEYNFLASATNAWTPGVVDNEDNNYSAFPNIDEKKLSADNVPLILRGKLHKKELKQSEFGSMTAQETAHFMGNPH